MVYIGTSTKECALLKDAENLIIVVVLFIA